MGDMFFVIPPQSVMWYGEHLKKSHVFIWYRNRLCVIGVDSASGGEDLPVPRDWTSQQFLLLDAGRAPATPSQKWIWEIRKIAPTSFNQHWHCDSVLLITASTVPVYFHSRLAKLSNHGGRWIFQYRPCPHSFHSPRIQVKHTDFVLI